MDKEYFFHEFDNKQRFYMKNLIHLRNYRGLIFLFLLLPLFSVFGLDDKGSISGEVHFNSPSVIFIYLVDEESSRTPLSGVLLKIEPSKIELSTGCVSFKFTNLTQGSYGIRCFQDLNNNEKLDKGLFGPNEPWGFSWNKQPPPNLPDFSNYCHWVSNDITNIKIYLRS